MRIFTLFCITRLLSYCTSYRRCGQKQSSMVTYHLVRPCTYSQMNRLASANLISLTSCMVFARKNSGLAFSFLSQGIQPINEEETTCQVFECPEFESTLDFQHTSPYYYYSLYARPLPSVNVSCLPGVGIFTIHFESKNYTEAQQACNKDGSTLANVLTEQRTTQLAILLSYEGEHKRKNKLIQAYVGLNDMNNEGTYVSSSGELLECTRYRAWAPGEPHSKKGNEDCVVLNSQQKWQVVKCSKKFPFICEFYPAGPIQMCNSNNSTQMTLRECLEDRINRTEIMKQNPRCHLPPSYEKTARDKLAQLDKAINDSSALDE